MIAGGNHSMIKSWQPEWADRGGVVRWLLQAKDILSSVGGVPTWRPLQNAENRDESPLLREKTSKCMKLFCAIQSFFAYFTLYNRWILLYNEIV